MKLEILKTLTNLHFALDDQHVIYCHCRLL